MPREYKLYLSDILEALERIQEYTKSMTFKDFAKSNITIDAVVRNLEVIGEAARKLPSETKLKSPEVEWRKIVALRNILTHEYFGLNKQIVWDVVQNKLEPISNACKNLLESSS
jgi:uncharacterized protein with HEPN domain